MTETYTAVIDRFEDDQAVLLLEDDGDVVDELVVDITDLPDEARHQNAVLTVTQDEDGGNEFTYKPKRTESRLERARRRFDRLARRPPRDEDR